VTVFVSYSSRDRDAVNSLTQDLQDADEQVWMDQRLAGGEAWWRAILEQIRGCDVFIFALSQNSIESKPCEAELKYAQALGLPLLPVQVGPVDSMQLNPLATVQAIDYRHQTPNTGMRLIAALNRERARRQPVPEPPPDEPPVPFEYLIRLFTTIAGPDHLSPHDQAALLAQLQVGLREDGQHEAARKDIVMLLGKLRDREDVTYRTRSDVDAILASIGAESPSPPPMSTETTKWKGQPGLLRRRSRRGSPTDTDHEPADKDRATLDRPTDIDVRIKPDRHRISADTPVTSATKATSSPPAKPPLFQRLSRRAAIVLAAAALILVAVIATVIGVVSGGQNSTHNPASSPPRAAPQVVLPFAGLSQPGSVAVDVAGSVYVTSGGNQVLKLAPGAITWVALPSTGLSRAVGVAVDAGGNVYVTGAGNQVLKLASGATTWVALPFTGLNDPHAVAADTAGNVYVVDGQLESSRVLKLAAGATIPTELPFGSLTGATGFAVDSTGSVYVADAYGGNQVLKLVAGGSAPTTLMRGVFKYVAVDAGGNVYVVEFDSNRVLKLATGTTSPTQLPFTGLNEVDGVAADSAGNVYVTDPVSNRVLKLPAG
jgi:streptogramin lyase